MLNTFAALIAFAVLTWMFVTLVITRRAAQDALRRIRDIGGSTGEPIDDTSYAMWLEADNALR